MPASTAPRIARYDSQEQFAITDGGRVIRLVAATKVELMAIAKYRGIAFVGKPTMHFPVEAIRSAILENRRVVNYADCKEFAAPKVPTATVRPTVPMQNASVPTDKLQSAIAEVVRSAMSALPSSSVDMNEVSALIANQTEPHFAELHSAIASVAADLARDAVNFDDRLTELSTKVDSLRPVEIHLPNRPVVKLNGVQHHQFDKVLKVLAKNRNVFMVGSAGTGKTTIAERAAQALGLEFSAQSFNAQSSKADLVGFTTANGVYIPTEFRKRFQDGGVYLLDEIDNANPNILGTLNAALANGYMAFPDGMVKRHPEFVAIAAGNTYGNGATAQYVGRNPIDAATKDRFVFMDILIDENVEAAMVQATGLDASKASQWLDVVRKCRANVQASGLQIIVSPRAAENGAHLLDAGFSMREVVDMTILKGAKQDQADKVLANVTL